MAMRRNLPAPLVFCIVVVAAAAAIGCKKTPPAAASTPEPPAMEKTASPPAEPVSTRPLQPAVEEQPMPTKSLTATELNAQGLLKAIYFDFDKHEIRSDQRSALQANAAILRGRLSAFNIVIEGHCDERGTNEYNMTLGDRRANAAKQYLIDLGIPAGRFRTVSYGEERPAEDGHDEAAWAKNRRGEFVLEEG